MADLTSTTHQHTLTRGPRYAGTGDHQFYANADNGPRVSTYFLSDEDWRAMGCPDEVVLTAEPKGVDLRTDLSALTAKWDETTDRLRGVSRAESEWTGDKLSRREANTWDVAAEQVRALLSMHSAAAPTADSTCTCENGSADDCIPCGAPGDATTLCDTCLSYADPEETQP